MLLVIGLTQVDLVAALAVVGWLFFIAWRRNDSFQRLPVEAYNIFQVVLILLTAVALGTLVSAVGAGLLGRPEMFIAGNESTRGCLRWFRDRTGGPLPRCVCISISIWWYRLAMLAWALWLAAALLRWLRLGWQSFSAGGFFHHRPKVPSAGPPPLPKT